jgi:hypothetical protein
MLLTMLLVGCSEWGGLSKFSWPFEDKEEQAVKNAKAALNGEDGHSKYVGDYIAVRRGLQMFVIEGIGLVTGLAGTGYDDGPPYRDLMLEDMRKRSFPRPEEFLRSTNTCIVVVRAYVPPLVRPGDRLDVEVRVPEGSGTTSLRGGTLLECELTEVAFAPGKGRMEGRVLAKAKGPLLSDKIADEESNADFLQAQIPGGALYVGEERDLAVGVEQQYANYRMSTRIANRIGERFFDYDKHGIQERLAEAKTHQRIDLKVHSRYRDNYPRYIECVRAITIRDSTVERNLRMQELTRQLLVGPLAAQAAIHLEAIGREAVPYLKSALTADSLESRFYAAEALAYLGDAAGVEVLAKTAAEEPAFRIYALAALSASMCPEALIAMRPLFDHASTETRYGAFRAYTTIDPVDPTVAPLKTVGQYSLHAVDSSSAPVVHITQRRKAEIVLFGANQVVKPPAVLRAGRFILVRSNPTGDRLIVTQIEPGRAQQRKEVSTRLVDLLLAVDEFGADYPDVVQLLIEADRQGNLSGALGIDELPRTGRVYNRPGQEAGSAANTEPAGATPNLFDDTDHSEEAIEGPIDLEEPEADSALPTDPVAFHVK